jgi:hypothetical protein
MSQNDKHKLIPELYGIKNGQTIGAKNRMVAARSWGVIFKGDIVIVTQDEKVLEITPRLWLTECYYVLKILLREGLMLIAFIR